MIARSYPITVKLPASIRFTDEGPGPLGQAARLPNEIWAEVASRLPRADLKKLFLIPHPLREFASEIYFRDITLCFDTQRNLDDLTVDDDRKYAPLESWQKWRATGIMTCILRDPSFAKRVKTLTVYAYDLLDSTDRLEGPRGWADIDKGALEFEISKPVPFMLYAQTSKSSHTEFLVQVLAKLVSLKTLELSGASVFLSDFCIAVPNLSPNLEGLTIKSVRFISRARSSLS